MVIERWDPFRELRRMEETVDRLVTAGFDESPAGPLYPELAAALGDTPVHHRVDGFDAFFDEGFATAIEATGRKKLVMAGIQTDVCLALTALTALNKGYEVYVVVDASAATTKETHDYALQRLIQAGAVPINWLAVGSELLRSWTEEKYAAGFAKVIFDHLPSWRHSNAHTTSVREFAEK
jgi:isochorismate hydrolase